MVGRILSNILKNQKQMMILIVVSVSVMLLLYAGFVLKPLAVNIAALNGKLADVSAKLKAAESVIARMDSMKAAVEAYQEKVDMYEKTLPSEGGVPSLLEGLSKMANDARMRIVGIVPVESKGANREGRVYQEIPIMISAKSGYHELGLFMSSLENSDRLMKIADILIRSNRATVRKHDIELLVVTYLLTEGK
ncbi:MAG: type 4a pilus biogenesis protein PilO [Candidatus Omnitrophica bacterium]|nr:type 4a pilus biogenesis protein PilO [Candidatus Omnitrophota bacterium]